MDVAESPLRVGVCFSDAGENVCIVAPSSEFKPLLPTVPGTSAAVVLARKPSVPVLAGNRTKQSTGSCQLSGCWGLLHIHCGAGRKLTWTMSLTHFCGQEMYHKCADHVSASSEFTLIEA